MHSRLSSKELLTQRQQRPLLEHGGRGFGHTLLRQLIAQARRDGISGCIYVEVEADHDAMLRLLTRAGFGPDPADPVLSRFPSKSRKYEAFALTGLSDRGPLAL